MYGEFLTWSLVEQARAADEVHQQVIGNRADRAVEIGGADLGRQPHGADRFEGNARLAVDVAEIQHVARIDQVRVADRRVDVPDLRPVPGIIEVHARNVPQRVAFLDDITLGSRRRNRHGHRAARLGLRQRQPGGTAVPAPMPVTAMASSSARIQRRGRSDVDDSGRRLRSIPLSIGYRGRDRRLIIQAARRPLPTTSQSRHSAGRRRRSSGPLSIINFKRDITLAVFPKEWRSSPSSNIQTLDCVPKRRRSSAWAPNSGR